MPQSRLLRQTHSFLDHIALVPLLPWAKARLCTVLIMRDCTLPTSYHMIYESHGQTTRHEDPTDAVTGLQGGCSHLAFRNPDNNENWPSSSRTHSLWHRELCVIRPQASSVAIENGRPPIQKPPPDTQSLKWTITAEEDWSSTVIGKKSQRRMVDELNSKAKPRKQTCISTRREKGRPSPTKNILPQAVVHPYVSWRL